MKQQEFKELKQQIIAHLEQFPKPAHKLTEEQLQAIDFRTLPAQQIEMLQKISFFSEDKKMLKTLQKQYSQAKNKQNFIKQNINYLTTSENITFTNNKKFYHQHTFVIPAYTVGTCTVGAFLFALWRLPSRKSPIKITLGGLTVGIVSSYAYWKYSMFEYYAKLNTLYRTIIKIRYQNGKRM